MTLYEALRVKTKEVGVADSVLDDLIWGQKQAMVSWGIRVWKADGVSKYNAICNFSALIDNELSLAALTTAYYKNRPLSKKAVKNKTWIEYAMVTTSEFGGDWPFWEYMISIAPNAVRYACCMHCVRKGEPARLVAKKYNIAERTAYNLRSRVVSQKLKIGKHGNNS